jgi:hypothetical protein
MEEDFWGMFYSILVSIQITFIVNKKRSYIAEHPFQELCDLDLLAVAVFI